MSTTQPDYRVYKTKRKNYKSYPYGIQIHWTELEDKGTIISGPSTKLTRKDKADRVINALQNCIQAIQADNKNKTLASFEKLKKQQVYLRDLFNIIA